MVLLAKDPGGHPCAVEALAAMVDREHAPINLELHTGLHRVRHHQAMVEVGAAVVRTHRRRLHRPVRQAILQRHQQIPAHAGERIAAAGVVVKP